MGDGCYNTLILTTTKENEHFQNWSLIPLFLFTAVLIRLYMQARIEALDAELANANLLLGEAKKGAVPLTDEDVEALAPSAAAASKMLRSGMSLSQIYNEYVKVSNQLEEASAENTQLKDSLESIFNELEAKVGKISVGAV